MESIFKRIPPPFKVPKQTWNINILFNYFLSLSHNQNLSLVELSRKLATLLMIATMCRKAELVLLSLDRVEAKTSSYITFWLDGPPKTANHQMSMKRLKELSEFKVQKFPGDIKLCPLAALKEYFKRTHRIRNTRKLFISNCPPFQRAKSMTISAWIKKCMIAAGIDISVYSVHSIRSALSTAAVAFGAPVDKIMSLAGWAKVDTFIKSYFKPELVDVKESQFVQGKADNSKSDIKNKSNSKLSNLTKSKQAQIVSKVNPIPVEKSLDINKLAIQLPCTKRTQKLLQHKQQLFMATQSKKDRNVFEDTHQYLSMWSKSNNRAQNNTKIDMEIHSKEPSIVDTEDKMLHSQGSTTSKTLPYDGKEIQNIESESDNRSEIIVHYNENNDTDLVTIMLPLTPQQEHDTLLSDI